jgi:two-component system, OmpR family, response regulator MprA
MRFFADSQVIQTLATDPGNVTDPPTILVVDDEPGVRDSLALALELESFRVVTAEDGVRAMSKLERSVVDAIVLDIAMPFVDGLEVCRRLRGAGNHVPILMLTAKDAVDDRVAGLEAGADDYLPKPFALRELIARLRAIMRRTLGDAADRGDILAYADVRLDRNGHRAWRGQRLLTLTRTEFLLLECFLVHPELVLTRSQIQLRVWGYDFGAEHNSLGVYVGYLRRKLEQEGEPRLIHTVRSVGYVLRREP